MTRMGSRGRAARAGIWMVAAWLAAAGAAGATEHVTGTMAQPGGARGTVPVWIHIDEYAGAAEVARLEGVLRHDGPAALQRELAHRDIGWLRIGDSLGYPLGVAVEQQLPDGGRRILLAGERRLSMFEAWNHTRSAGYPFSYVAITVDRQGHGSGEIVPAAKIDMSGDTVVVESWAFQPAKLLGVEVRP